MRRIQYTSVKINVTPGKLYRTKKDLWISQGLDEGKVFLVTKVELDRSYRSVMISFLVGVKEIHVPFSCHHDDKRYTIQSWVDSFLEEYK